jgi:Uma2 family endonuclease
VLRRNPEYTAEELLAHPDRDRSELVRGTVRVSEPPGGVHGRVVTRLASRLAAHVEHHRLGVVLVESGYVLRRGPDTVRGPDISFVSAARMPPDGVPEAFIPGAPDLAVEVLSPDDHPAAVEEKVTDYLEAGARMVWLVDPRRRQVVVRYAAGPPRTCHLGVLLEGEDLLPGFACPIREVFGE